MGGGVAWGALDSQIVDENQGGGTISSSLANDIT
jgi:hypothetical protein